MFVDVMSKIWNILGPVVEIGILTYVFYRFYTAVAQTKAQQIFKIIFVLLAVYAIAYITHLQTFLWLYKQMAVPIVIFICVVYQPELRRAFTQLFSGRSRIFRIGVQTTAEQIDSILNACTVLVSKNRGALIVFTRHLGIKNIIDSGTKLNADLSSALILTVFDHDTPLHDGAMVIQGNKIVAAGCYLPLSEQTDIKKASVQDIVQLLGLPKNRMQSYWWSLKKPVRSALPTTPTYTMISTRQRLSGCCSRCSVTMTLLHKT